MPVNHLMGQAQFNADAANLVFEQLAQWFNQFQFHVIRQPTYIVV